MKTIVGVIVVVVVLVGGYFLLMYRSTPSVNPTSNQPTAPQQETSASSADQSISQPSLPQAPAAEKSVIIYTDTGYSPNTVTIKVGETVLWKNQSSRAMWTASGAHPTHRLYPETGGCIGSAFDACRGAQPGGSWSFKFDIAGTWKYHNHLNSSDTGMVIISGRIPRSSAARMNASP